jgi:hypothetical protein
MKPSVTIMSARDGTKLTFSDVTKNSFLASLENLKFSGCVVVSTYLSGPPSLLFEEMALQWRGWEGKKEWAALEGELRLTATSDHTGHIELVVVMGDFANPANWQLEASLQLEAGQLEQLARSTTALFNFTPERNAYQLKEELSCHNSDIRNFFAGNYSPS